MFLLSLLFFLIISIFFYNFYWKRRKLPPGPIPIPILGNVQQISGQNRYKCYQDWAAKYGPIFTIWIGEHPVVIVTDYELIKATMIKDGDSYVDRDFLNNHFRIMFGSVDGIIRAEGEQWRQLRKFMLRSMRDYGLEGKSMEVQVIEAVSKVIEEVEAELGAGLVEHSIDQKVDLMTGSVINRMLLSYGFYEKEEEFAFLKKQLDELQEYFASFDSFLIESSPMLRHLPYFSSKFLKGKAPNLALFDYARMEISRRIEAREKPNYSSEGNNDMLDQFLDQIEESDQKDPNNYFNTKCLEAFIFDIFLAGQETTSNTLNFLILYLILDQGVQDKLHEELDRVMGAKREKAREEGTEFVATFGQADRVKLPFTNAVVHETQRLCNLLPMNLTRNATRDVEIGGHKLPKGTTLVPQISTVLYDERYFPEPSKFLPERFLDEKGQFKKVEEFVPFGVGKRICPGEALARMELFLFTANFFYKFHVYDPNPLSPIKNEKRQTFAVKLPEYKCHVEVRS